MSINEILNYIETRKDSRVFRYWTIGNPAHRADISFRLLNRLLFWSRDGQTNQIAGVGLVNHLGENKFHITHLVADNSRALKAIIQQFIQHYPDAVVSEYDRRGKRVNVKDSKKLLTKLLTYGR